MILKLLCIMFSMIKKKKCFLLFFAEVNEKSPPSLVRTPGSTLVHFMVLI